MKWTGLTGGIATGKSTAKKLIESLGIPVVDADQISHGLTVPGEKGYLQIVSHFGKNILNEDFSLNRKKLGHLVFANPQIMSELENILHPLIRAEMLSQRKYFEKNGAPLCFYDVPLLFEKKLTQEFDTTVLIWCNTQTQLERLMKRSGLTVDEAVLRIKNQLPMIDKVKLAEHCVDNSGDTEDLGKQIKRLIRKLQHFEKSG